MTKVLAKSKIIVFSKNVTYPIRWLFLDHFFYLIENGKEYSKFFNGNNALIFTKILTHLSSSVSSVNIHDIESKLLRDKIDILSNK